MGRWLSCLRTPHPPSRCCPQDIVAKIVDGSKDFVAVKAREAFGECTSMSCLEASGAMHTFIVAYREHPSRLEIDTRSAWSLPSFSPSNADGGPSASFNYEEISNMKQELYHIGTSAYDISILCENIFVKDDVLFPVILRIVKNRLFYR